MGPPGLSTRPFQSPRLWPQLPLLCLLQQTLTTLGEGQRKMDNGVKTKVSDSSEGKPSRRVGIQKILLRFPLGVVHSREWSLHLSGI
uniref:Uncharacterized protein n=1 Tax=Neovison vison TaxID=452646 RepID=A0A8C7BJI9_NEOVI